jgi:hypothetical protein
MPTGPMPGRGTVRVVVVVMGSPRRNRRPERWRSGSSPGIRFGLIDQALDPVAGTLRVPPQRLAQLKHDLAAIISAEALFSLTDLCRLAPDDAVGSLVRTATTITAAATRGDGTAPSQPGKRRSPRR